MGDRAVAACAVRDVLDGYGAGGSAGLAAVRLVWAAGFDIGVAVFQRQPDGIGDVGAGCAGIAGGVSFAAAGDVGGGGGACGGGCGDAGYAMHRVFEVAAAAGGGGAVDDAAGA